MPELGCTSAVQNEKIHFFIFCTAGQRAMSLNEHKLTEGDTSPSFIAWGSIPQVGNTFIRGIHVFASQGIEP